MFIKIVGYLLIVAVLSLATLAYCTKDMNLAVFALTFLVAISLHDVIQEIREVSESARSIRKKIVKLQKSLRPEPDQLSSD